MDEEKQWKPCWKKPVQVEYREVIGEKEEISTREGKLFGYAGQDYIIRGIRGEEYPCKKDIFEQTYSTTPPELLTKVNESQISSSHDERKEILAMFDRHIASVEAMKKEHQQSLVGVLADAQIEEYPKEFTYISNADNPVSIRFDDLLRDLKASKNAIEKAKLDEKKMEEWRSG
jgi:hypothetical protein